jgi:hypothetical protein
MSAQPVEEYSDPEVRVTQWLCEDGWIVGYSMERYGTLDQPVRAPGSPRLNVSGLYAMHVYRPVGKGSRSGNYQEWKLVTLAPTASRSKARLWAKQQYWAHNPKAKAEAIANGAVADRGWPWLVHYPEVPAG